MNAKISVFIICVGAIIYLLLYNCYYTIVVIQLNNCTFKFFAKFTAKHLCQSLFFNKVAGFRPATLLKKRLWRECFPVNFAKFLKTSFLENTSGRLLLTTLIYFTEDYSEHGTIIQTIVRTIVRTLRTIVLFIIRTIRIIVPCSE